MIVFRNIAYIIGLAFFYYKYVPLVPAFQLIFVPILLFAAGLAWLDLRRGAMFFIFAFPLINNLPYYFGIAEPTPLAPTALVLFLFFFLGVLLNRELSAENRILEPSAAKPICAFAVLIAISAFITILRYANYFPLHGMTIYEIKTNTFGVSAGGAIMSVVFQSLNYLTGLAFFLILMRIVKTKKDIRVFLSVMAASSIISLGFALFQHYGDIRLGNNPTSILNQLINGTYKDAMSFGAYLSMAAPVFLGIFFAERRLGKKLIAAGIVILSSYLILFSGSKIALFGLVAAYICFGLWAMAAGYRLRGEARKRFGRKNVMGIAAIILAGIVVGFVVFKDPIIARVNRLEIVERFKNSENMLKWRIQAQWMPAVRMIGEYPLTGVGLGGYIIEAPNYTDVYQTSGAVPESAENHILQIGSELGIVGLLAVIWIAWTLIKEIRRGFRRQAKAVEPWRAMISIGAASGILAFVVNAQMHSYIGSYEIKYLLWLLLGIIYCLSRLPEGEDYSDSSKKRSSPAAAVQVEQSGCTSRRISLALTATIFLFGVVHLWNSTHALSLQARTEKLGLVQDFGLYAAEKTPDGRDFRWTREYGAVPIKINKPILSVPILSAHPDIVKKPITARFYLVRGLFKSKQLLKEITIADNDWRDVDLLVPDDIATDALLLIEVNRTWNPEKALGIPDQRKIGVAVGSVVFRDRAS